MPWLDHWFGSAVLSHAQKFQPSGWHKTPSNSSFWLTCVFHAGTFMNVIRTPPSRLASRTAWCPLAIKVCFKLNAIGHFSFSLFHAEFVNFYGFWFRWIQIPHSVVGCSCDLWKLLANKRPIKITNFKFSTKITKLINLSLSLTSRFTCTIHCDRQRNRRRFAARQRDRARVVPRIQCLRLQFDDCEPFRTKKLSSIAQRTVFCRTA